MAMSRAKVLKRLDRAQQEQTPVVIRRNRLMDGATYGFVLQVTKRWLVLHELDDGVYVEGYDTIRMKDITSVKFDRAEEYIERALSELGRPTPDFSIPIDAKTREVIEAAASRGTLIGVHSEQWEGEPLWIGRLGATRKKRFDLLFINRGGKWDARPDTWRYKDISRVSFGGRYYTALERFGDALPPHPSSSARESPVASD